MAKSLPMSFISVYCDHIKLFCLQEIFYAMCKHQSVIWTEKYINKPYPNIGNY